MPHVEDRRRRLGGRPLWLALVAGVLGLVLGGLALTRTSLFHARAIEVSGASSVGRGELVRTAGIDRRTNVLWLDEAAVELRLEQHPWVAEANVVVAWPTTIRITVVEREPIAVARDGTRALLIAGDGTVLGSATRGRGLPTIALSSSGIAEAATRSPVGAARALGAMDPTLRSKVARVSVLLDGTLDVWLRSGPRIRFGAPTSVRAKASAITEALSWADREGERILVLSVVSPSAPAATLAP